MRIIGSLTDKILYKVVGGEKIPLTKEEDKAIRADFKNREELAVLNSYISLRRKASPNIQDQLDAIWKHLAMVRLQGQDLASPADYMLNKVLAVWAKYPEPEGK